MPSLRSRFVNRLLRATTKPIWRPGLDIATVRTHTAKMERRLVRKLPPIATEAVEIAAVPATWYGPQERAQAGTLLYLHGGAWCLHLPRIYARFASILSELTGMRVLLPEYRLAPEHAFPAGVDDCLMRSIAGCSTTGTASARSRSRATPNWGPAWPRFRTACGPR